MRGTSRQMVIERFSTYPVVGRLRGGSRSNRLWARVLQNRNEVLVAVLGEALAFSTVQVDVGGIEGSLRRHGRVHAIEGHLRSAGEQQVEADLVVCWFTSERVSSESRSVNCRERE